MSASSEQPPPSGQDDAGCPFCFEESITRVTDCYDDKRQKICELWFCRDCGGFFPRLIVIPPPDQLRLAPGAVRSDEESEKRRAPRFPVQFVVQVDFDEKSGEKSGLGLFRRTREKLSEPLVAMVMNAGIGGLCFRYPEPVEEGKVGRMKISLPSARRSFSAVGKVVRSTQLPDGGFGLGIQFVEVDQEYRDALQRYMALE